MIRSSVVLPEPLSPRIVRNSPSAISSETLRSTALRPKVLATLRMLSSVGLAVDGEFAASVLERAFREGIAGSLFVDGFGSRASIVPQYWVLSASSAPPGLAHFSLCTHGLRRVLHSFAAPRLRASRTLSRAYIA